MRRVASNLAKLPRLLSKQNEKWKKPDGDGGTHLVAGLLPGPFEGGPMMGEPINHENRPPSASLGVPNFTRPFGFSPRANYDALSLLLKAW